MAPIMPEHECRAERQRRAWEITAFRKKYPPSRRLKADHSWAINRRPPYRHFEMEPFAKDWLNTACPGWDIVHMPETRWSDQTSYIGFAKPEHVEMFAIAVAMQNFREKRLGRRSRPPAWWQ